MPNAKHYTTDDLIQILAVERQACLNGQRLNLTGFVASTNPVIDQFVNTEGGQKFTAYLDFRATVHQYQRDHHVSGLVQRQITLQGTTLNYPDLHDQLIALTSDLTVLRAAKGEVSRFWEAAIAPMDLYLSVSRHQDFARITRAEAHHQICQADWVSLSKSESRDGLEITLQLYPEFVGTEFNRTHRLIVAVSPGQRPIH